MPALLGAAVVVAMMVLGNRREARLDSGVRAAGAAAVDDPSPPTVPLRLSRTGADDPAERTVRIHRPPR